MSIGQIDRPLQSVSEDRLSLSLQVQGFANFLLHCQTPITAAIQGRWGSGKTSFVNMARSVIRDQLGNEADVRCPFVTFNAWQFSQFNMQSKITTSMLSALTQEISKGIPDDRSEGKKAARRVLDCVSKIGRFAAGSLNDYVEEKAGVDVSARFREVFAPSDDNDAIGTLLTLQENFNACVRARLGITGENPDQRRLVIFVDDLDRVSSDRAVEVLETLKLFLDCPYCVFVLAIDYEVVVKGVSLKYSSTLSKDKGNDFFEKMIQVVYTMPESMAHTERLISSSLRKNGLNISVSSDFASLVKAADKNNPRTVKRILNSFYLLHEISRLIPQPEPPLCDQLDGDVALFATLCLQIDNQALFDFIQSNPDQVTPEFLDDLNMFTSLKLLRREAPPKRKAFLRQLGLLTAQDQPDPARCDFLQIFLTELYFCIPPEEIGLDFDLSVSFTDAHVRLLRHYARLSELSRTRAWHFTEDDTVAALLFGDELSATHDGTIDEAFASTAAAILRGSTPQQLVPVLEHMDLIFSPDPDRFPDAGRLCLAVSPKTGKPSLTIYYNGILTPDEKVRAILYLALHCDFPFTWFRDRMLREPLLSYGDGAPMPQLREEDFTVHPTGEDWVGPIPQGEFPEEFFDSGF